MLCKLPPATDSECSNFNVRSGSSLSVCSLGKCSKIGGMVLSIITRTQAPLTSWEDIMRIQAKSRSSYSFCTICALAALGMVAQSLECPAKSFMCISERACSLRCNHSPSKLKQYPGPKKSISGGRHPFQKDSTSASAACERSRASHTSPTPLCW